MIYLTLDLNCVLLLEVQLSVSVCMSCSSLQLVWVFIFRAIYVFLKNKTCVLILNCTDILLFCLKGIAGISMNP